MSATSYTLSTQRLRDIRSAWRAAAEDGDTIASQCAALFAIVGTQSAHTLENQRGQALTQYILDTPTPVPHVALILTHSSALVVHDESIQIAKDDHSASDTNTDAELAVSICSSVADPNLRDALQHTLPAQQPTGAALKELNIQEGVFAQTVIAAVRDTLGDPSRLIEAGPLLGATLYVKDTAALAAVERAAGLCSAIFRREVRPRLARAMAASAPADSIVALRDHVRHALQHPSSIDGLAALSTGDFSVAAGLTPCVFVRGEFVSALQVDPHTAEPPVRKPAHASGGSSAAEAANEATSRDGVDVDADGGGADDATRRAVVVVRYGMKSRGYTAFMARTLLVHPRAPPAAAAAYRFAFLLSEHIVSLLRPHTSLAEVYARASSYAQAQNPALAAHLPRSFGFVTGLLVLEGRGSIAARRNPAVVVRAGMCLVVRVTLEKVPSVLSCDGAGGGGGGELFDVELSDTVVVRDGGAEVRTRVARKPDEAMYESDGDGDGDGGDNQTRTAAARQAEEPFVSAEQRDLSRITRHGQTGIVTLSREAQRDAALHALLLERHAEFLAAGGRRVSGGRGDVYKYTDLGRLCYPDETSTAPRAHRSAGGGGDVEANRAAMRALAESQSGVAVDGERQCIVAAVGGADSDVVCFPICTIQRAEVRPCGTRTQLTLVFHAMQEANVAYKVNRTRVFVKELTFTASSHNPRHAVQSVYDKIPQAIQAIQQRIRGTEAERKRRLASAGATPLRLDPHPLRLPQVKMRPSITVGRQNRTGVGNLELHTNGLRFSYLGGVPVELLFENIRHIIFQPAVNAIAVIYHLTLHKPVEIGRKSGTEVQFYAEVMESSEAATGTRQSFESEVAAEAREEARVKETNMQFITFARAVEGRSGLRTQLPMSRFSFDAVHSKAMTTFKGSREVLWAIADWPPFTVAVHDVEVVSLERVLPGGQTFDATLIMKDYHASVRSLHAIARTSLEVVKDWCLAARLYYMESTVNPNWRVAMKDIREDGEWQPWLPGAGWSLLNHDYGDASHASNSASDNDGDDSSASDSTYEEESSAAESEEDDSDDSSWLEDEESSAELDSDKASSSSAASSEVSWDAMERKAREEDRRHALSDTDSRDGGGGGGRRRARGERGGTATVVGSHKRGRVERDGAGGGQRQPQQAPAMRPVKMAMTGEYHHHHPRPAAPPPRHF